MLFTKISFKKNHGHRLMFRLFHYLCTRNGSERINREYRENR